MCECVCVCVGGGGVTAVDGVGLGSVTHGCWAVDMGRAGGRVRSTTAALGDGICSSDPDSSVV